MPKHTELPPDYFHCPALSKREREYLIRKAQDSARALVEAARCVNGPIRWVAAGQHKGVQIYKGEARCPNASSVENDHVTYLCGATCVNATLEEVAAYMDVSTTTKLKAFCRLNDDVQDGVVLYQLAMPNESNNFLHQITVRWLAIDSPAGLVVHDRDFLILECQDVFTDPSGRRGWVRAWHSVKLPCCPDQRAELGYVRGSFYHTGYVFVESDRAGWLDCIHSLQVNLKGKVMLPSGMLASATKRRISAVARLSQVLSSRRLIRHKFLSDVELVPKSHRSRCQICAVKFGVLTRKHHCRKCGEVVCSKCSEMRIISSPHVFNIRLCSKCNIVIDRQNADSTDLGTNLSFFDPVASERGSDPTPFKPADRLTPSPQQQQQQQRAYPRQDVRPPALERFTSDPVPRQRPRTLPGQGQGHPQRVDRAGNPHSTYELPVPQMPRNSRQDGYQYQYERQESSGAPNAPPPYQGKDRRTNKSKSDGTETSSSDELSRPDEPPVLTASALEAHARMMGRPGPVVRPSYEAPRPRQRSGDRGAQSFDVFADPRNPPNGPVPYYRASDQQFANRPPAYRPSAMEQAPRYSHQPPPPCEAMQEQPRSRSHSRDRLNSSPLFAEPHNLYESSSSASPDVTSSFHRRRQGSQESPDNCITPLNATSPDDEPPLPVPSVLATHDNTRGTAISLGCESYTSSVEGDKQEGQVDGPDEAFDDSSVYSPSSRRMHESFVEHLSVGEDEDGAKEGYRLSLNSSLVDMPIAYLNTFCSNGDKAKNTIEAVAEDAVAEDDVQADFDQVPPIESDLVDDEDSDDEDLTLTKDMTLTARIARRSEQRIDVVKLYRKILALTKEQHSLEADGQADTYRKQLVARQIAKLYEQLDQVSNKPEVEV